ncbi:MAG: hypothetical protein QW275_00180 [Candidatus Anstonellaceae archaeon]
MHIFGTPVSISRSLHTREMLRILLKLSWKSSPFNACAQVGFLHKGRTPPLPQNEGRASKTLMGMSVKLPQMRWGALNVFLF